MQQRQPLRARLLRSRPVQHGQPSGGEDDNNPCTRDFCDPERGQVHEPIGLPDVQECALPANVCTGVRQGICLQGACMGVSSPNQGTGTNVPSNCSVLICDPVAGTTTLQRSPIIGLGCSFNCNNAAVSCVPSLCPRGQVCPATSQCNDGVLACTQPLFTPIRDIQFPIGGILRQ